MIPVQKRAVPPDLQKVVFALAGRLL